ncbi:MAG: hypothetical protein ACI4SC_04590, partial [Candidatus Neoclostridium sp.]
FRNFDADENDPASYDFECTDAYMKTIYESGTQIFYRLGASIEHGKKFGTFPPKDFLKWAKICEHIIMHYNEGWANGFNMNVLYWEIWNEPDCRNADGSNPCWQGTPEQFVDFFTTAANYLKAKFPSLKIGGPAVCSLWSDNARSIVGAIADRGVKLDFISYHGYDREPSGYVNHIRKANEFLQSVGYGDAETYLNEWNYVKGWLGDDWIASLEAEQGLKGSSFVTGVMCACQKEKISGMMYYDARPYTNMNGMFDPLLRPRKGYYSIAAFGKLLALGNEAYSESDDDRVFVCAATDGDKKLALITYYADQADPSSTKTVCVDAGDGKRASVYLLDQSHNLDKIGTTDLSDGKTAVSLKLYDTVLLEIE